MYLLSDLQNILLVQKQEDLTDDKDLEDYLTSYIYEHDDEGDIFSDSAEIEENMERCLELWPDEFDHELLWDGPFCIYENAVSALEIIALFKKGAIRNQLLEAILQDLENAFCIAHAFKIMIKHSLYKVSIYKTTILDKTNRAHCNKIAKAIAILEKSQMMSMENLACLTEPSRQEFSAELAKAFVIVNKVGLLEKLQECLLTNIKYSESIATGLVTLHKVSLFDSINQKQFIEAIKNNINIVSLFEILRKYELLNTSTYEKLISSPEIVNDLLEVARLLEQKHWSETEDSFDIKKILAQLFDDKLLVTRCKTALKALSLIENGTTLYKFILDNLKYVLPLAFIIITAESEQYDITKKYAESFSGQKVISMIVAIKHLQKDLIYNCSTLTLSILKYPTEALGYVILLNQILKGSNEDISSLFNEHPEYFQFVEKHMYALNSTAAALIVLEQAGFFTNTVEYFDEYVDTPDYLNIIKKLIEHFRYQKLIVQAMSKLRCVAFSRRLYDNFINVIFKYWPNANQIVEGINILHSSASSYQDLYCEDVDNLILTAPFFAERVAKAIVTFYENSLDDVVELDLIIKTPEYADGIANALVRLKQCKALSKANLEKIENNPALATAICVFFDKTPFNAAAWRYLCDQQMNILEISAAFSNANLANDFLIKSFYEIKKMGRILGLFNKKNHLFFKFLSPVIMVKIINFVLFDNPKIFSRQIQNIFDDLIKKYIVQGQEYANKLLTITSNDIPNQSGLFSQIPETRSNSPAMR